MKQLYRHSTRLQNIIVGELSISFLMWILNRIILIREASFVTQALELMSSVSSITSAVLCLDPQLVMVRVHIVYKMLSLSEVKIDKIE